MKNTKTPSAQIDTLVGAKTRVEGDIHFQGGLHVDGGVKGAVVADQDDAHLSVSDQGTIEGEIRVPRVTIDGVLVGDIVHAEEVELASKARVTGSISYASIKMALGAQVTGSLTYRSPEENAGENVARFEAGGDQADKSATKSASRKS